MPTDKHCAARLAERIDFTDDLALFRFRLDEQLDFVPGQYATLALEPREGERPVQRPYSVASAPHEETFDFFIERVEGGALTERLWDLKAGARCWIRRRVVGLFTLDTESGRRRHVMAATVTGVGPYVSIVRAQAHALRQGTLDGAPHHLLILHGASRPKELGSYCGELTAGGGDWLTYVPTISRPWLAPDWTGERGRAEDVLRKHMDDAGFTAENAVGYACGHPQMIENAKGIFARAGFDADYVREEKYFREAAPARKTA